MSRRFRVRNLSLELLLAVLIALAAGACVYFPLQEGLYTALDRRLSDPAFYEESARRSAAKLQNYVDEHGLLSSDTAALDQWANGTSGLVLYLWKDNRLVYGTGMRLEAGMEITSDATADGEVLPDGLSLTVRFPDGPATAVFYFYYGDYYYLLLSGAAAAAGFIVIVAVLLLLIHRKTAYIAQMERELKILEGGDLSYAVTVRGSDELAELAQGIDDMRRSIIDRERRAEEARAANHALVTAMSHDLRSPLTALIGYLDLIREGKCGGPEQAAHFIEVSRSKAYQIKELSDKLFEYFLVYDRPERKTALEEVDGRALLDQVVEEGLFDLESRGFQVERSGECPPCRLRVNVALFRRLFGNLFSNIEKYAAKERPVAVRYALVEGGLEVRLQNGVAGTDRKVESTEIGLKTCEKIMADHGGRFRIERDQGGFSAEVWFPAFDPPER